MLLIGTKQAEASDALVLRLWVLSGKAVTAHIRLPLLPAGKATLCNLVEVPEEQRPFRDGAVGVPIRGFGLATVLLE